MRSPRRTTLATWLAIMTLILAACGGAASTSAADGGGGEPTATAGETDGGNTVSMAGQAFSPSTLTIAAGDTVTFTDTSGHTVTEGTNGTPVDDPIVDETGGADIEVTFDEPGSYNITCKIHPDMNMTITVEG
jgi:plastocyanin